MRQYVIVDVDRIRQEMKDREMTETAFAVFVGLGQSTISRLLLKRGECWLETAAKLAKGLGVPLENILAEPLTESDKTELEIFTGGENSKPSRKALERLLAVKKRCGLCRHIKTNENAVRKEVTVIQGNPIEIKKCGISDWLVTDVNRGCSGFEGVRG